jgi:hypothetical protein
MKLAIIGTNPEYFNFLSGCEIIEDYDEADVIVFSGTFNYRSATTKFNRISNDKLVIGVGNACEFLAKRYDSHFIKCALRKQNGSCSLMYTDRALIIEGVIEAKNLFIPGKPYRVFICSETGNFQFNISSDEEVAFLRTNYCPIVMSIRDPEKPRCLMLQLDPRFIGQTSIANYINELVCAYKDLL